ncbi:MAG TPA: GAF domain-containing sensor histidine kinase, partial [Acidimicrobiales bacterium]|nr:GAF domain-containing sensor histidine kinase [Acidimicrobiales bacterium]
PERLQALIEAMLLVDQDLELPEVLSTVVRRAVDLVGARYAALGVLDPSRRKLAEFVTVGVDEATESDIGRLPEGNGILGRLIEDPRPIRLADVSEHDASVGFPKGHPPMRSFLGVPIVVRDEVFGSLYLADKQGREGGEEFTEMDEDVVSTLALAAGLAIDKARLYSRMRELTLSEERERIARNLHDTVIQRLFAVGLSLQGAIRLLGRPEAQGRLLGSIDDLDETIRQIRTTIFAMNRPPTVSGGGLRAQILEATDEAAGKLGLEVKVDFDGPIESAVSPEIGEHLMVSLREAIANVVRHAKASTVEVRVQVEGETLVLRVVDDGVGFDPVVFPAAAGRGLANLSERAKLLGGACDIRPGAGAGTELIWQVKLQR